ncbi:hypothetical protein K450DRAFT_268026 [Umbelopsis ramanniana AG]|uniref:Uncharacterized protein n=1 Tax=Umbelopsis ramanniana AG TaxID=1314678 RepID=A0AAD5EHZ8_UMBRA|nr:uncharacterized protein K450DRAFT_268026 [Umbelopsis ramanniana AG]KAI8584033.1 hypothetical protein K450DRAFT_268026 [Umbelopsis ramanniana AG]
MPLWINSHLGYRALTIRFTDSTTPSDQNISQTDGSSSDSGATDSTSTDDPTSATPDPGTSSPTPQSTTTTTTTTQEPTTTTTTTDAPTTETTTEEPSPTVTQSPQTTPSNPAPFTTTDVVVHVTSVIASQPSSISSVFIPSSSMTLISSSVIASAASTSVMQPLPTTASCSANNATCPTGQYCNASNQTCQVMLADGTACSSGNMCLSGTCSDSICGPSSSSSGQNSAGKIAGIVLGSVGGVGCAVGVLLCVRRRNRNHQIQRMRGFTPSMALNGHLNDKNMGSFKRMNNAERHKSDYSFTSEQAALESLSSMSMSMSPIGRQSAVYYKDNQLHSLSGTMSPFEDGDATSYTSSQPVMMASVPLATYKHAPRSSKFDFLQNALANRHPIQTAASPLAKSSPSIASSVRNSGLSSVNGSNWEALISPPRSGFVDAERRGSNRMSSTTFGSGHHHVGIGDDESVADPIFSPAVSHASARVVMPNQTLPPPSHNPFRTHTPSIVPQDAWTKEDEDGMKNYQYF